MEEQNFKYAGLGKRFAAMIIDGVIVLFFASGLRWTIREMLSFQTDLNSENLQLFSYAVWSFYLIFIRWSYFSGMESSPLKATFGKLALGLYVVNLNGERIGFGQASGRFFGKILSSLILYIGYLMAGFTDKKQALHDQMSNCLVLEK